jgi:hypothetical protein
MYIYSINETYCEDPDNILVVHDNKIPRDIFLQQCKVAYDLYKGIQNYANLDDIADYLVKHYGYKHYQPPEITEAIDISIDFYD